jgi:tetratricopeptide (TPR) repeat protein
MKIKFLSILFLVSSLHYVIGQKSGSSAKIAAIMSMEEYTLNPQMKDKLEYAVKNIDIACEDQKTADDPSTWRTKGSIYSTAALDEQLSRNYPVAATDAFNAFEKSLSMEESRAEVKGKTKDKIAAKQEFIDGFSQVGKALYKQGSMAFNEQKWEQAFTSFSKLSEIPTRTASFDTKAKISLKFESGKETIDMLTNSNYLGGIAAVRLKRMDEAEKLLKPLMDGKKIKEEDIRSCYRILSGGYLDVKNIEKAKTFISEGRKNFPTDYEMLITSINIALQEGRLAELEGELSEAVKSDPNNSMLHFVMGNMYDELFRKKVDYEKWPVSEENLKQGKIYFDKAIEWYNSAIKLKKDDFNSVYSLGAIHVNFSNYFATLNKNSDKIKKEERAAIEKEYFKYVDTGLSYLLEAEKIDPNDLGLIRGLKEVYTRKSDDANWKKYSDKEKEVMKKGQ